MKQLVIFLTVVSLSLAAIAQQTNKPTRQSKKEEKRERINAMIRAEEEGVIAYKKHFVFGIKQFIEAWCTIDLWKGKFLLSHKTGCTATIPVG
jgi:hypothetical protein